MITSASINEEERIKSLKSYQILDSIPEQLYDDLVFLALQITKTSKAMIGFIDEKRVWIKSAIDLDVSECDRNISFCNHTIQQNSILIIPDTLKDLRFKDNPLAINEKIRFYAGVPLNDNEGNSLGTLCVMDEQPRELSSEQIKSLERLGRQVMALLEARKANIHLEETNKYVVSETDKYKNMMTCAPAVIAIFYGPDHVYHFSNPEHRKLINNRDVIGKPVREAMPELIEQGFPDILDKVYQTGQPVIVKEVLIRLTDSDSTKEIESYLNLSYQPIFDKDKKVKGIGAFAFDVTELVNSRKKLEALTEDLLKANQEIEYQRHKLNNLFMNAPASICLLSGPEHIYEFVNHIHEKQSGVTNAVGKTVKEARPDMEKQGMFKVLDQVYSTGKPFSGNEVCIILTKNGQQTENYYNFIYQPVLGLNGQTEGISGYVSDVTEQVTARKKLEVLTKELSLSEAKYKTLAQSLEIMVQERTLELSQANIEIQYQSNKLNDLFMNAPASICLLGGPEHIFKFINPLYHQLVGGRDVINKTVRAALPELEGQGFYELLDNVYNTGEPFIGNELPMLIDKTGNGKSSQTYMNFVYQPVFSSDNKVEGISVFAFEVTDQVIARQRVENLSKELERSNAELSDFASIASHDLQAPLRTVSSYVQLLVKKAKGKLSETELEFIDFILNGTKRMQDLINSLLEYSKLGTGKNTYTEVDLNKVMPIALSDLQLLIEDNQANVTYDKLPTVKVEQSQIIRLFQNLTANALKYRSDDAPVIKISVEKQNNQYLFSVKDNGIGIDEKYHDRIFQIFQRLEVNRNVDGTGIGLANCKKIIEQHGGKIWVESVEGKGSTFYFTLPV